MKDITGQTFGEAVAIRLTGRVRSRYVEWECKCSCGTIFATTGKALRTGQTRSCGCLRDKNRLPPPDTTRHRHSVGGKTSPTYNSWRAAKQRVSYPKHKGWRRYGGRGIKMDPTWFDSFDQFLADMGERPPGKTLDREDPDGDYGPENCRWATPREQRLNCSKR